MDSFLTPGSENFRFKCTERNVLMNLVIVRVVQFLEQFWLLKPGKNAGRFSDQ